jgi:hypothetical protein
MIITYFLIFSIFIFAISVDNILQDDSLGGRKEKEKFWFHSGCCPPSVSTYISMVIDDMI